MWWFQNDQMLPFSFVFLPLNLMFSLQWTSIYQQKGFDQILMLSKHTTVAPANLSNAAI